jgi:hypothetical protein
MQVDHYVIQVHELESARENYAKLGFTLTPLGTHSANLGSANYCVMFAQEYLELYGLLHATEFNQRFRDALQERGEALGAIAIKTRSSQATCDEARGRGITVTDPVELSRPIQLDDGTTAIAAFRVNLFESALAGVQLFACEHLTPQIVRRPTWLRHPNTALGCDGCVVASGDPQQTAAEWSHLVGNPRPHVQFVHWADAGEQPRTNEMARVVELAIAVSDLDAAFDLMVRNGVPGNFRGNELVVSARNACGVRLRFSER